MDWTKATARRDETHLKFCIWCVAYIRDLTVVIFRSLEINIPDLRVRNTNLIDQAQALGTCLDVCLVSRQQLGKE